MSEEGPKIKNLEELIQPLFASKVKILSYETKYLTSAGENYGSTLLSVDIKILEGQKSKTIHAVAKICPENEWLKRMFAVTVTFKKEIGFYKQIIPTLIDFQKSYNVPEENLYTIFPKCLNARLSLNSNDVDDDAVLLLENLKCLNYRSINRLVGFTLEEAEPVLKNLARFHAVPLAYKIKRPNDFKTVINPFLDRVFIGREMFDKFPGKFTECLLRHLTLTEEKEARFVVGMDKGYDFQKTFPSGDEKYATIVHCDFWPNNTLLKFENNKPVNNKMLDFQSVTYGAPASDLVFLIFTGIELETLDKHYDYLLKIYYDAFVNCLKELQCDITTYTYDSFLKEVNLYGPLEASHILVMFRAIFKLPMESKMEDMNIDDMFLDHGLTDIFKKRLCYTVNRFFSMNWF